MKKLILAMSGLLMYHSFCFCQAVEVKVPKGFDVERPVIAHGKVDTITYASKEVGTNRRATIYAPEGFSTKKCF